MYTPSPFFQLTLRYYKKINHCFYQKKISWNNTIFFEEIAHEGCYNLFFEIKFKSWYEFQKKMKQWYKNKEIKIFNSLYAGINYNISEFIIVGIKNGQPMDYFFSDKNKYKKYRKFNKKKHHNIKKIGFSSGRTSKEKYLEILYK